MTEKPTCRVFCPEPLKENARVLPDPDRRHYIGTVMRAKENSCIALFNSRDGDWLARITCADKKKMELLILSRIRGPMKESVADPWLLFAPLKKECTDFIVQKATELGVRVLWPVTTRRTNTRRINQNRLTAAAIEAVEQCERLDIPDVQPLMPLENVLSTWDPRRPLYVADETGSGSPLLKEFQQKAHTAVAFLTGPEGGFHAEEMEALRRLPFVHLISLGPRILRAETAALVTLGCWQAACGDGNIAPRPEFL